MDKVLSNARFDPEAAWAFIATRGVDFGLQVLAAIALWIVGRWLIGLMRTLLSRALLRAGKIDATLAAYLVSFASAALSVLLVLLVLDVFGIQATSFAALLAGVGLAIGTAWGGLLAHFAAGVFMQVLRPYRVGDLISAGGTTGRVHELGLISTTFVTPQNVLTVVGNSKIFASNIENFSALPVRRIDCSAKLPAGIAVDAAIERLFAAVSKIENVAAHPKPEVAILEYAPDGSTLCVRPYAHTDHYWQVYFDTNRAIAETLSNPDSTSHLIA